MTGRALNSVCPSWVLDSNVSRTRQPSGEVTFSLARGGFMDIRDVGVVGAGTMGNGIAHVLDLSGFSVILCDVEQRFLDRGIATISKNLDREVAKNKISAEDKASALKKIEAVTDRARLADCDFIVEAANEQRESKTRMFCAVDPWAVPV